MHGEYKVPGGKLVVVDLEVDGGRFSEVRLAGDFFLEPDDALEAMNATVTGMPADASSADLASALRRGLPDGAELLGVTPEGIATAIRRAVSGATGWGAYDWRLLRGPSLPPRMQVALDEVLAQRVGDGRRQPTLRFWEWDASAVVIGSFQSVMNEVDEEQAAAAGYEIVRRISGGGAMLMGGGQVIVYSIYAPAELVAGMSFADSYAFLDAWAVEGLRELGIDATYQPLNDIASPQGKIGGAAQKRLGNGGVLHHVTMAYDMDGELMARVLRIGREKLSDKGIASAAKRVDPLRSQTSMQRDEIVDHLVGVFERRHGLTVDELTADELAEARRLVAGKFETEGWTRRVP